MLRINAHRLPLLVSTQLLGCILKGSREWISPNIWAVSFRGACTNAPRTLLTGERNNASDTTTTRRANEMNWEWMEIVQILLECKHTPGRHLTWGGRTGQRRKLFMARSLFSGQREREWRGLNAHTQRASEQWDLFEKRMLQRDECGFFGLSFCVLHALLNNLRIRRAHTGELSPINPATTKIFRPSHSITIYYLNFFPLLTYNSANLLAWARTKRVGVKPHPVDAIVRGSYWLFPFVARTAQYLDCLMIFNVMRYYERNLITIS
jgi:hypothetical protein